MADRYAQMMDFAQYSFWYQTAFARTNDQTIARWNAMMIDPNVPRDSNGENGATRLAIITYGGGAQDQRVEEGSDDEEDVGNAEADNEDEAEMEYFDKWGELDADAERTEEATERLAVCNMDWDRVGAEDIFLLLSSFCPAGAQGVTGVHVYLSGILPIFNKLCSHSIILNVLRLWKGKA